MKWVSVVGAAGKKPCRGDVLSLRMLERAPRVVSSCLPLSDGREEVEGMPMIGRE